MDTLVTMETEALPVTNIHGQVYQIERRFLQNVIIFAWLIQILAVLVNLGGYLIHPMAVEKSVSSKMFVHVFGRRYALNGKCYLITKYSQTKICNKAKKIIQSRK